MAGYDQSIQLPLTIVFVIAAIFLWRKEARIPLLVLAAVLQVRYLLWRGLFTLDTATTIGLIITLALFVAECYGLLQNLFFSYQSAGSTRRLPPALLRYPTVDIFVPIVNEPLEILHRTLIGCLAQDYPRDRFIVHVLDDGGREDVHALARDLGCEYLRRQDTTHAKAGNLNHALRKTKSELIAILDVDHVPVQSFLERTVGFFDDDKVAIVQTPHYFYNPDIYQKNLRLEREIKNDQDLFFRVIQPGRDAHNSAFFAGSSGLFRRTALEEIGWFRTNTLTEDLCTSLVLHARGWKSVYLNEILAAGLTPESQKAYLRQRERWGIGAVQTFLRENPLMKKGLTIPQRIDYTASIYYFFQGIPRIVYLAAPLSFLIFGIAPIVAPPLDLVHYFLSYYFVSVIVMEVVGKGYRRIFWSDVYETMMSFTLSKGVITALFPFAKSTFYVTPKGTAGIQARAWKDAIPHMVLFTALLAGIAMNIFRVPGNRGALVISMFWAGFNALLLLIAILASLDRPQRRRLLRMKKRIECVVRSSGIEALGFTDDISEDGASVTIEGVFFPETMVELELRSGHGEITTVAGDILRQEKEADGIIIGIRFRDIDLPTYRSLIRQMYSPPTSWLDEERTEERLMRDALLPLLGIVRHWKKDQSRNRRYPRLPLEKTCSFVKSEAPDGVVSAHTLDISYSGLSILIMDGKDSVNVSEDGMLTIGDVNLKVTAIAKEQKREGLKLHLKVDKIIQGEEEWKSLSLPS